jgi:hypothetical protein
MLAILGRSRRTGRWRLASRTSVLALLGACHLDLRASFVEDDSLKMKVTVLFGSATFLLPVGAEVRPSGMSVLAASTVDVLEQDETADLPMLEIEWIAILGRIRIITHRDEVPDADVDPDASGCPVGTAAPVTAGSQDPV